MSISRGRGLVVVAVALLVTASCKRWAREPRYGSLRIEDRPFDFKHNIQVFETGSGLRYALIHDTRTNLATVDLRYAVGAAEDPPGRAGLAHLAEHLVFYARSQPGQPSVWDRLGELALTFNASTSWDRTHYESTVPIEHLDEVIALEGRRMRTSCAQIDEATFLRERDVVLAETAQTSAAIDTAYYEAMAAIYGAGHPYARSIATNAIAHATREEVCTFIERHYAPNRAYLVVTGPFDADRVRLAISAAFGPITRRAADERAPVAPPRLDGRISHHSAPIDHPTAMVYLPHPAWGADGTVTFRLAQWRLRYALAAAASERDWILDTDVARAGGDRAPLLVATVVVTSRDRLEDAAAEVFARAANLFDDVGDAQVAGLADGQRLAYLAAWDDLATRGKWIADFMQYTDHNRFMLPELRRIANLDSRTAVGVITANLTPDHSHVALIMPRAGGVRGTMAAAIRTGSHDLESWRAPVDPADADRPLAVRLGGVGLKVERYRLANGLEVALAPDPASPIVDARLVFPAGRAHEPPDRPSTATAAAAQLDMDREGYYVGEAIATVRFAVSRGTTFDVSVGETSTTFAARGLAQWGDWHVWYLSWRLDLGGYDQRAIDALHAEARTRAKLGDGGEVDPAAVAFLSRLFGPGHPYATPAPDAHAAYLHLGVGDLERWKRDHYRAPGATLIVSGAFDVATMKREIDELFGPWPAGEPAERADIPAPRPAAGPSWLANEVRDAVQVEVNIAFAIRSDPVADRAARAVLALMLDDQLRVVREGMGASYGVDARYRDRAAGGALVVHGFVDEAQAGEAARRILAAIATLRDDAGAQREAFVRARRAAFGAALARTGGAMSLADELEVETRDGLPHDVLDRTAAAIAVLTPADVAVVAAADLAEARMVVMLGGRAAAIDPAYAVLAVTPERIIHPERETETEPEPEPEPEPEDAPRRPVVVDPDDDAPVHEAVVDSDGPALPRGFADDRLTIGNRYNLTGPRREGLFQGDRPIPLDEFLRITGHGDRAARIASRRRLRRGLVAGAILAFVGGVTYASTRAECGGKFGTLDAYDACTRSVVWHRLLGYGVALGGVSLAVTAFALSPRRPSDLELRSYAASYNRRRRIPAPVEEGVSALQLAPVVSPTGGALVLSGRF